MIRPSCQLAFLLYRVTPTTNEGAFDRGSFRSACEYLASSTELRMEAKIRKVTHSREQRKKCGWWWMGWVRGRGQRSRGGEETVKVERMVFIWLLHLCILSRVSITTIDGCYRTSQRHCFFSSPPPQTLLLPPPPSSASEANRFHTHAKSKGEEGSREK